MTTNIEGAAKLDPQTDVVVPGRGPAGGSIEMGWRRHLWTPHPIGIWQAAARPRIPGPSTSKAEVSARDTDELIVDPPKHWAAVSA
jgi:hypothetical protein